MARRGRPRKIVEVKGNYRNLIIGAVVVLLVLVGAWTFFFKKPLFELPPLTPPATVSPEAPTPPPAGGPTPSLPVKKLPDTAGEPFSYTVKKNDSLYGIGMTFCDNKAAWLDLAEQNKLSYPYILRAGETLTISCP